MFYRERRGRKHSSLLRRALKNQCFSICVIIIFFFLIMVVSWKITEVQNFLVMAKAVDLASSQASMLAATKSAENRDIKQELEAIKAKYPNPSQKEIELYVKTIFGKDADTAIKISRHECFTWDKAYPKCHLKTSAEDSIGVFQVNLYNSKQWIHAGRIPGTTIAEKELWLENPFNNTLYAYWVFKTSGWNPWTSYTSGRYLK